MQAVGQQQAVAQPPLGWAPGLNPGPTHAPTLAELLGRWGHAAAPPLPLAERLGACLDWTDAVLLSQALAAPEVAAVADAPSLATVTDWAQAALERLQVELRAGFADPLLAAESALPETPATDASLDDALAAYRLHHGQQQRAMAQRCAGLRERLRGRLSACGSARLARLAQLDAVFDRALAARERQALAALGGRLLTQRAAVHRAADAQRWRRPFWADLQLLLQAELDFRLQAPLGLIEALQAEPIGA